MCGISWPKPAAALKNTGIVLLWSGILAAVVVSADFLGSAGLQAILQLI